MAKTRRKTRKVPSQERSTATRPFRRICNLVPSKNTGADWHFEDAVAAGALGAVAALPRSVDLRASWWAIADQEDTGSCVGWATAEGVVRYQMTKAGKMKRTEQLSPRFIWMSSKETDEFTARPESFVEEAGTSLKSAMDIVRKYGAVKMSLLPFHLETKMFTGSENTFYAAAAQMKVASYFNLEKDLNKWKSWLSATGPILAGLSVDATWDKAASTQGNLDTYQPALPAAATRSPSLATLPPVVSSSGTVGGRRGVTRDLGMRRLSTSPPDSSMNRMA